MAALAFCPPARYLIPQRRISDRCQMRQFIRLFDLDLYEKWQWRSSKWLVCLELATACLVCNKSAFYWSRIGLHFIDQPPEVWVMPIMCRAFPFFAEYCFLIGWWYIIICDKARTSFPCFIKLFAGMSYLVSWPTMQQCNIRDRNIMMGNLC